ncbi:nascent polypeptide-associated complex subunit alpha, muscle-specific form-like [Podarcis lilfordi]|uniref:Nascent polypeptide-associated complex subunit alpha, muscle-specific form-like n=2 Tax=Podarcis lilfordi TaxID=74358 RepID=A0AA35PPR8_9SAUR|nr:nascent polypeptide-associated complex subunit alpha, muscle-specific form-like [Podarcis lilfordi]
MDLHRRCCRRLRCSLVALLALLAAAGRSGGCERRLDASAAPEGPPCSDLLPKQPLPVEGQEAPAPAALPDPLQVDFEGGGREGGRQRRRPRGDQQGAGRTPQPGLAITPSSGSDFSGLQDSLSVGQSTSKTLKTLLHGSAEPSGTTWHRPSSTDATVPTASHPDLQTGSAVLDASQEETPRRPTEVEESRAAAATGRGTQFPTQENTLGAGALPHPSPPLITTKPATFSSESALLPGPISPKDAAGQNSWPSSLSEESSSPGAGEEAPEVWQSTSPSLLLASKVQAATQTQAEPQHPWLESQGPPSATTGGNETRSVGPTDDLKMPTRAGSLRPQETQSPTAETQGTLLLASTPQPVVADTGAAQEEDVATITTQILPQGWSTAPSVVGAEGPGGSTPGVEPETRSHESWGAVGPSDPGSTPAPPPTLLRSRARLGHTMETTQEAISAGSFVPSGTAPVHNSTEAMRAARPVVDAQPTSAESPHRTEVAPHSSSSVHLGTALPLRLADSATHPASASNLPVGSTLLTSSVGPGGVMEEPRASRAGGHASADVPMFQNSTDPLTAAETASSGASTATEEPGSQSPSEAGSAWPMKGGDRVQSSSQPRQLTPKGTAEEGTSPTTVPTPMEVSVNYRERTGVPSDAREDRHKATTRPTQQATREGSLWQATEAAEPFTSSSSLPGKGAPTGWTPSSTKTPVGSEAALFTPEGDDVSTAPSLNPELHSQAVNSSSLGFGTAVPTSKIGDTGTMPVTHRLWTSPGRTRSWEWVKRPSATAEGGSIREIARSPLSLEGLVRTTATPTGSSGHTQPPLPAPGPKSTAKEEPLVASTWLSPATPEKSTTQLQPAVPREGRPRAHQVFVAENQLPRLKATLLHIPCELVLAMEFSRSFWNPDSLEYQGLVLSVNETVTPLFDSLPGFQRLEVKAIRPGSVVVAFDALFLVAAPGLWAALNRSSLSERLRPGLWVGNARVLQSTTLERHLDLCSVLFACQAGYECVSTGEDGSAVCTSACHRDYCKNEGICTHAVNHTPVCQCPVGSDFWFLGVRCDYKVTQQGLLGVACGLLLSLVVVGAAIAGLVIRRVRMLLLEARADQTKSSYRRFCRLDDVSAHYWSEPWLASAVSLDNPAFSNSEELLHLQILDTACCSCQDDCMGPDGYCKQPQDAPCIGAAGRPSAHYNHWDVSSNSMNDPMIDSGKASEVSVSSWPMEPIQWSPCPALHNPSREQVHKAQRPHSYCEGMELVNLERSWTA